ncbi:hypothetical protein DFJ74DRAFT_763948 [Hyaloraphidium curvatum]|nr:hypothetical protein DFJ74DRAFT_763948 [Hyaloraphidium curvatum]
MLATDAPEATTAPAAPTELEVKLVALDGNSFTVPFSLLKSAEKLAVYIQGELTKKKAAGESNAPIEVKVPHCTSFTIEQVLRWLEIHADDAPYDEKTFVPDITPYAELSEADLVQFMLAADIFGIPALAHTAGAKFAELLNNSEDPQKLLDMLNPEELEEVEVADEDMEEGGDEAAVSAIAAAAASAPKPEEAEKAEEPADK